MIRHIVTSLRVGTASALAAVMLSGLACDPIVDPHNSTHYLMQVPASQRAAIDDYVACVNSRFPLRANRWAYVNADLVAEQLLKGRLDEQGMETAYRSLGCGFLNAEAGG